MNYTEYVKCLKEFQKLLEKVELKYIDLASAISTIQTHKDLKYEITPIRIELNGKFPKRLSHANVKVLELEFDLNLHGAFQNAIDGRDPFTSYGLNIVIFGLSESSKNILVNAMHLDRHDGTQSNTVHPYYHFQFGGNRLKDNVQEYGQVLILDSPRIMYHPMDFILTIDFIVSNFLPETWEKLKKESMYISVLEKVQKLFVAPYFRSLVNFFDNAPNQWKHDELYPQLVGKCDR